MVLPKILVVFVFLFIIFTFFFRSARFGNKYVMIGIMIIITLGVIFSDSLYHVISKRVLQYSQSPQALQLPFISERWKSVNPQDPSDNTRQRMSADLLMHHKPSGRSKIDIINMLGEPDKTKNFPEWDMEYYLGQSQESFRSGTEWLVIKLNENDSVTFYNILTE